MALSNNTGYSNSPLVYLNPRSSTIGKDGKEVELEKPRFEVSRVNADGNIEKTDETANNVSGNLVKLDFKEREIKGQKTKHVVLYIQDSQANETYFIDFTYRISTRSLFNAMLSLKDNKDIELSIYRSKKGYESFGLRQAGEQVSWKYSLDALPQAEQIKDKKGAIVKTDFSEVNDFFENELRALAASLFGEKKVAAPSKTAVKAAKPAAKANAKTTTVSEPEAPEEVAAETRSDEDIPF